jgi:hypothetical protein
MAATIRNEQFAKVDTGYNGPTERAQDHQQPLPQTRGDLPVIELSDTQVFLFV